MAKLATRISNQHILTALNQSSPAYKFTIGSLYPSILVYRLLLTYKVLLTWVRKDKQVMYYTCTHTYIHACIHTGVHTHMHTYIHTLYIYM